MAIRLYVVDWSGTVSDDKRLSYKANVRTMQDYGRPPISFEEWCSRVAHSSVGSTVEFFEELGIHDDPAEILRKNNGHFETAKIKNPPQIYSGVKDTIGSLHGQGRMFAVLSTHPETSLGSEVFGYGLSGLFWKIVGSSEQKPKVSKAHELGVLCQLADGIYGIRREQVAYVADMVPDKRAADEAGVQFIAVSYGYHPREVLVAEDPNVPIVDSFTELQTRLFNL